MYSASAEFATETDLCCGLCKGGIHANQATKIATKFPPEVAEDSVASCRSSLRSDGFYAYLIKLYNPWKNFYGEVRTLRRYVFSPKKRLLTADTPALRERELSTRRTRIN